MKLLNIAKIEQELGKKIQYYEEIESTHLYAKKIAKNKENDGTIIIAEMQTSGIGTKGRTWYTGKGKNIALTMIIHPKCNIKQLENLPVEIAKKIQKSIYDLYGYKLEIKEPNDLMLEGKKICGILTEIQTIQGKINYLLISFGFNVNEENFSDETKKIATSLKEKYHKDFEREEIIIKIIKELEK